MMLRGGATAPWSAPLPRQRETGLLARFYPDSAVIRGEEMIFWTLLAAASAQADDAAPADTTVVSAPRIARLPSRVDAEDDQQSGPNGAGFIARQPG
jgi:hypothetical protein